MDNYKVIKINLVYRVTDKKPKFSNTTHTFLRVKKV